MNSATAERSAPGLVLLFVTTALLVAACATADDPCLNTCNRENIDRICVGGQIAVCTRFSDGCLHYGQSQPCGGNLTCAQEGEEPASCEPVITCTNSCELGARSCSPEGLFQTCVENAQGCTVFDTGVECPEGERCDGGACVAESTPCENECPSTGIKTCVLGSIRECGQYDADDCLELSAPVECAEGEFCQEGACAKLCAHDCAEIGDVRCAETGEAVETCEADTDGCRVWSTPSACGQDERCDAGACVVATVPCEDDCTGTETQCLDNAVITCGQNDSDDCLEFGPPAACGELETCEAGACQEPVAPTLLIHELQYNPPGDDALEVFLEITGPAGASLDGVSLVDFNGNTGNANHEIDLSGNVIPDDGLFVITNTEANTTLAAEADFQSASFDPENGNKSDAPDADAIQLRWNDTIIDALGYGGGVGNQFGEGAAAPDASDSESLQRSGGDTDDNATDFVTQATPTPGVL